MYMLTQLAKMMFLATFFPMPELEEEDVSKLFWSTSLILPSSNQPYLLLFTPSPPTLPPPFLFWPTSAKCLRNIALARPPSLNVIFPNILFNTGIIVYFSFFRVLRHSTWCTNSSALLLISQILLASTWSCRESQVATF